MSVNPNVERKTNTIWIVVALLVGIIVSQLYSAFIFCPCPPGYHCQLGVGGVYCVKN